MRKSDKDMVLKNQVMSFCKQETLALAMEIEYKEALNFWTEVWKAVEMCMVCILAVLHYTLLYTIICRKLAYIYIYLSLIHI